LKRFLLPLFVILSLNFLLNEWFKKINKEAVIWELDNDFYEKVNDKEIQYLILGNSHSFGIETYENDSLVHFASYGENWSQSYYKLNHLINQGYSIDHLLLNYDLTDTRQIGLDNKNLNYWAKYINFFELGNITNNFSQYIGFWVRANFMSYAGRYFEFFEYYTLGENPLIEKQEVQFNPPDFVESHKRENDCLDQVIKEEAIFYLEKIIALCTSNDIQLVLIKYPITKYHYYKHSSCFDPSEYYNELNKRLHSSNPIQILDYQKLYFDNNSMFRDDHHLIGSIRGEFSQRVRKALEKIWN